MKIVVTSDIDTCRTLRRKVFIDEQGVSEDEELDGRDKDALHMLAWLDGRAVATARMFIDGDIGKIGRVCVLPDMRGAGLGLAIMQAAVKSLAERGVRRFELASQCRALSFYEKLGFVACGPEFLDAGILHRNMVLEL